MAWVAMRLQPRRHVWIILIDSNVEYLRGSHMNTLYKKAPNSLDVEPSVWVGALYTN